MKAYLRIFVTETVSIDELESIVAEAVGSSPNRIESLGSYWKIPNWYELLVQLTVGKEEELATLADSLGKGWTELNGEYFWKIEDGGSLKIPFATWAHLELES